MMGARHVVSRACTSSNVFISEMVGWKFVFGQEDAALLFFKAQTFSGAIGIPRRTCVNFSATLIFLRQENRRDFPGRNCYYIKRMKCRTF